MYDEMNDEITPEQREWLDAPGGPGDQNESGYYKELLAVMYKDGQMNQN